MCKHLCVIVTIIMVILFLMLIFGWNSLCIEYSCLHFSSAYACYFLAMWYVSTRLHKNAFGRTHQSTVYTVHASQGRYLPHVPVSASASCQAVPAR